MIDYTYNVVMVSSLKQMPTQDKSLIVLAAHDGVLHFRVFDEDGNRVKETDETHLPKRMVWRIKDLRGQLKSLWPPHYLTASDKMQVILAVKLILEPTRGDRFQDWLFTNYGRNGLLLMILAVSSLALSAISPSKGWQKFIAVSWALVPPIYFFFEFHWSRRTQTPENFKLLKDGQDHAGKIWAGVLAALGLLSLSADGGAVDRNPATAPAPASPGKK
jgi:hypothetical protein